jgi:hypothetical protein
MRINRSWAELLIALSLVLILYIAAFLAAPSFLIKESETNLVIDNQLIFIRDKTRGVGVSVIGHSYDPPGIREFVSRVYHFVPGYNLGINGDDVIEIRTKNLYFINRSRKDRISPVAAVFTVNWEVEGKSKQRSVIVESGEFRVMTVDSSLSKLPDNMAEFKESTSGEDVMILNFTEIDKILAEGDEGVYTIEMKSLVNYTFIPWSGHRISNKTGHMVFKADVSYVNGSHKNMTIYYPLNSITEKVRITHPRLVRAKQLFGFI